MIDFNTLAQQCAPNVHPQTMQAVVRTESGFNPYAIGVVGGHLVRQPRSLAEAVATAKALDAQGVNFSMGLGQVNKTNLAKYGMTYETAFDLCKNLHAGSAILGACYTRAATQMGPGGQALKAAISCYYSGNFRTGFRADFRGTSYVQRVAANSLTDYVPAIRAVMDVAQAARSAKSDLTTTEHASTARPEAAAPAARASRASTPAAVRETTPPDEGAWDAFGDFRK